MSDLDVNGISARLWRLPKQLLLALVNATALRPPASLRVRRRYLSKTYRDGNERWQRVVNVVRC